MVPDFEEIENLIKEAWETNLKGSSLYVVQRKLGQAKSKCKKWCLEYKKEGKLEWETTNHDLTTLQQNLDQVEGQNKELRVGKEARMATDIKLEYWKQRAKANWDRQGDKPTTYIFKKCQNVSKQE